MKTNSGNSVYMVERTYAARVYIEGVWWTEHTAREAMRQSVKIHEDHLCRVTSKAARSVPQPDGSVFIEQQTISKGWFTSYQFRVVEHAVQGSAVDRLAELADG